MKIIPQCCEGFNSREGQGSMCEKTLRLCIFQAC